MKVVVKSPVWDDLREIALWIAKDNPNAAERFFRAAEDAFEMLRLQPGIGGLRSFSMPRGPILGHPNFFQLHGHLPAD